MKKIIYFPTNGSNLDAFFVALDKSLETFNSAVKVVLDGTFPHGGDAVAL